MMIYSIGANGEKIHKIKVQFWNLTVKIEPDVKCGNAYEVQSRFFVPITRCSQTDITDFKGNSNMPVTESPLYRNNIYPSYEIF